MPSQTLHFFYLLILYRHSKIQEREPHTHTHTEERKEKKREIIKKDLASSITGSAAKRFQNKIKKTRARNGVQVKGGKKITHQTHTHTFLNFCFSFQRGMKGKKEIRYFIIHIRKRIYFRRKEKKKKKKMGRKFE